MVLKVTPFVDIHMRTFSQMWVLFDNGGPPKNQIRLNFVLRTKHLKHAYGACAQDDPQEMERN